MKLKDFIKKLQDFELTNPDMEVCLADWNEEWRPPNAHAATLMHVETSFYDEEAVDPKSITVEPFLIIGSEK